MSLQSKDWDAGHQSDCLTLQLLQYCRLHTEMGLATSCFAVFKIKINGSMRYFFIYLDIKA